MIAESLPDELKKTIRVLIVDDSAVVRQTIEDVLTSDPRIEVMGTAADPYIAATKIRNEVPDVITLDVEMPRMDGLTFLKKIMEQYPIPVVICSSLTGGGSMTAVTALEYGAVEIITKPRMGARIFLEESRIRITDAVKAASVAKLKNLPSRTTLVKTTPAKTTPVKAKPARTRPRVVKPLAVDPKLTADVVLAKPSMKAMVQTTEKVVVVGASTGGTEALRVLLESLPMDAPGMVVVQHMPEHFTTAFSERLNSICDVSVKEAADGDSIIRGRVLIAPGNRHTLIKRSGARYYVEVKDGPLVCRHRPSVDVLFRSAASYGGKNVVGVLMTGMGDDGARGMKEIKEVGGFNIVQDEDTSVVYGMPKEAVKLGVVDRILPLQVIAGGVLRACD